MSGGSGIVTFFAFLPVFLYLAIIIFAVYFAIKAIKFMNAKIKLDQERNEKIEDLIKIVNQGNKFE